MPQPTRPTLLAALCALTALFALACGDDFQPGPLGAVEIAPNQPIEIGALLALSELPELSREAADGVRLAIDDYGEIHGRSVVLAEPFDSKCSPEGGESAGREAAANPQLVGVIGTICSGAAITAAPLISAAGLAMISPGNTAHSLTSDLRGNVGEHHQPGYLRVIDNDLNEGLAIAHFVYDELDLRRAAAVHHGDAYTSELADAFANAFAGLGGETAIVLTTERGASDLSAVLDALADAAPQVIFFPLNPDDAAQFVRQIRARTAFNDAALITADTTLTDEFLAEPETDGVYAAGPTFEFDGNANQATSRSFESARAAYAARFGEPASDFWAYGYDAATLLLAAIESVAVAAGGSLYIDRAALREALYATAEFDGLTGQLGCDTFGDCGHGQMLIHRHSPQQQPKLPIVYRYTP